MLDFLSKLVGGAVGCVVTVLLVFTMFGILACAAFLGAAASPILLLLAPVILALAVIVSGTKGE